MFKKSFLYFSLASLLYANSQVYYNPSFINFTKDKNELEVGIEVRNHANYSFKGEAKYGEKVIGSKSKSKHSSTTHPSLFFNSKEIDKFKFGFSIKSLNDTKLSKWSDRVAKSSAEKYYLNYLEYNPILSYKLNQKSSFAIGARAIKTNAETLVEHPLGTYRQQLKGDGIGYGYNLSYSYFLLKNIVLMLNYRSKVDIKLVGDAKIDFNSKNYIAKDSSVKIVAPERFDINSFIFLSKESLILVGLAKVSWSDYEYLNIDYPNTELEAIFGKPILKDWEDIYIYKLGFKSKIKNLEYFLGYFYADSPVPDKTLNFTLPVADTHAIATNLKYKINEKLKIGVDFLYTRVEKREISDYNNQNIKGIFGSASYNRYRLALEYSF